MKSRSEKIFAAVDTLPAPSRLVLAMLIPLLALGFQWYFWELVQPYAWFLFFPAIFASSWIGGTRGGVAATALSTLMVWWIFVPYRFSFVLERSDSVLSIAVYFLTGILFSLFHDRLRRANRQAAAALAEIKAAKEDLEEGLGAQTANLEQAVDALRKSEDKYRELCHYQDDLLEKERTAISRSIHDHVGQGLNALNLDLAWIRHKIERHNPEPEVLELIEAMRVRANELITRVQNISAELRSPLLDDLGITAAIEWELREFKRRSGVECHLSIATRHTQLDRELSNVIIRTLQESLTNIARHSGAEAVTVSLLDHDGRMIFEVADNGRGITEDELSSDRSFGIIGMQERAEACQGKLMVSGVPQGGTSVILELPLRHGGKG